jgi:hypothetical protein
MFEVQDHFIHWGIRLKVSPALHSTVFLFRVVYHSSPCRHLHCSKNKRVHENLRGSGSRKRGKDGRNEPKKWPERPGQPLAVGRYTWSSSTIVHGSETREMDVDGHVVYVHFLIPGSCDTPQSVYPHSALLACGCDGDARSGSSYEAELATSGWLEVPPPGLARLASHNYVLYMFFPGHQPRRNVRRHCESPVGNNNNRLSPPFELAIFATPYTLSFFLNITFLRPPQNHHSHPTMPSKPVTPIDDLRNESLEEEAKRKGPMNPDHDLPDWLNVKKQVWFFLLSRFVFGTHVDHLGISIHGHPFRARTSTLSTPTHPPRADQTISSYSTHHTIQTQSTSPSTSSASLSSSGRFSSYYHTTHSFLSFRNNS